MKKLLVALVYTFERAFNINGIVTKTFREEAIRRNHNAVVLQSLLTLEHNIRDTYNRQNGTVYTTKKACLEALHDELTDYNCLLGVKKADFR